MVKIGRLAGVWLRRRLCPHQTGFLVPDEPVERFFRLKVDQSVVLAGDVVVVGKDFVAGVAAVVFPVAQVGEGNARLQTGRPSF